MPWSLMMRSSVKASRHRWPSVGRTAHGVRLRPRARPAGGMALKVELLSWHDSIGDRRL